MARTVVCQAARNAEDDCVLGFPVCFLVFAALAWWLDAQNHMQELIGSLHYSQSYLSGLRMLYAGVIMILVNVAGEALFTDISGKAFVSMVLLGSSSVFLFALVCVYACHKGAGGLFYAGLIAVWACVCVIARFAETGVQMFLLHRFRWRCTARSLPQAFVFCSYQ